MILEETYESLNEGINDPGVFKAVFMAGGPGSGKSLAAKKLGFGTMGLRPVNSDTSFETGLKKAGLSLKMPEDEEEKRDAVRVHAKAMTGKRQDMYVKGRLGMVIDSTARDVKKIIQQKKLLEALGYECAMVFVNTSLETALDRNRTRERSIPDDIVQDNHKVVRANMGKLQNTFGRANFFIIDNDGDTKDLEKNTTKVFPRLQAFVKKFPTNKMAKAWKSALTMKPMKNVALAAAYEHPVDMDNRLFNEDRATDALKQKQEREREQLKSKQDKENDRDRLRITRQKNTETETESSDAINATKEKIYKDLKKKKEYFEKEYGDKADDVMHGTAMNMAKKQHKVAEGKFTSELTRQLQLEVLNMSQRRKIGMRMKRLAKKIARTKERKKRRMKDPRALKTKAQKQARLVLFKKMSGGKSQGELSIGSRIAIGKKLDKKKGAIAKLAKKLMPKVKKQEIERLAKFKQKQNVKDKQ
jgi:predicted kinase